MMKALSASANAGMLNRPTDQGVIVDLDRAQLEAMKCWFDADRVGHRPDITQFKRLARYRQAEWRERQGLPMGSHSRGGKTYDNGSKVAQFDEYRCSNFLSPKICEAVEARLGATEPHETLDETRLRYDLLSSMPMCFNLLGELQGDPARTQRTVAKLWGLSASEPVDVRFEWSPGRRTSDYLNDRTAFDAALMIGSKDEPRTIIGIETKYHEHATSEAQPNEDTRLPRYREVAEDSGVFVSGWERRVVGTELQQVWRDHLLLLSMLQRGNEWKSGKYVLVHPARNPAFAEVGERYREVLEDDRTFEVRTIEDLVGAGVLHSESTERKFRERYLW